MRRARRYFHAFTDLNGDGRPEVLVYLMGPLHCGSGGCELLVLTPEGAGYRVVTATSLTRAPIRVLRKTANGWRSLGVTVAGGRILPGHAAELAFDGMSYPSNPTVAPARRLTGDEPGEVVIPLHPMEEGERL